MTGDEPQTSEAFQLSLPIFEGAVDDLLRLVQGRKISTGDIDVSDLTAQYRTFMETSEPPDLDETGEFVVASSRILAIKSADLLLVDDEVDEDEEPRVRNPDEILRAVSFVLRAREGLESFVPTVPPYSPQPLLTPHSPALLVRAWQGLDRRTRSRVRRVSVPGFVQLEVAISGLIRRLRGVAQISFQTLIHGETRNNAVVHFMAVLELVRRRQARAEQGDLLGDITIEWIESERDAGERAG
jgi:segregation and condensation protein A